MIEPIPTTLKIVCGEDYCLPLDFAEIERRAYRERLLIRDFGDSQLYTAWHHRNPSIYTLVMSGAEIVGYVNAMPVVDELFRRILKGQVSDGEIQPAQIALCDAPGDYRLYFCSIAILPEYRASIATADLFAAVKRKWDRRWEQGIRLTEIAGVVWTAEGRKLCRALGMRKVAEHSIRGEVFHSHLADGRLPTTCVHHQYESRDRHIDEPQSNQ